MNKPIVHFAVIKLNEWAYAACSGWTCKRVPVTLLRKAVTCKSCKRTKMFKEPK